MAFSPALTDLSFAGGIVLGLGASLHCAGMCGSIGASMLFVLRPDPAPGARAHTLMTAQAARIAAYVLAGAVLGWAGSGLYGLFDRSLAFRVLQWAAAMTLGWIGLSIAGLLPALTVADRLLAPVSRLLAAIPAHAGGGPAQRFFAPVMAGLVWGLLPCAIVYAALFTAMLTGDAGGGARLMLGFGLGTLPSVTIAAYGLTRLGTLARSPGSRIVVGLAIAASGVLGLLLTTPGSPLCIT